MMKTTDTFYLWVECLECGLEAWVPEDHSTTCPECNTWRVIGCTPGWAPSWALYLHP
jgi:ribosomal protein S27E